MCWKKRHVSIHPLSHGIIINTLSCSSPCAPLPIDVDPSKMEHLKLLSRLFTSSSRKAPDMSSMVDGRNREEINLNRFHFHFRLPNWNSPAQHKSCCCCCRWKVKNASQVVRLDFGAFVYGLGKRSNKIRFFLERRLVVKMQKLRLCDFTWTYTGYLLGRWHFANINSPSWGWVLLLVSRYMGPTLTTTDHHFECCVWVIKYISRNAQDQRQRSQRAASLTETKTRYKLVCLLGLHPWHLAHVGWVSRAFAYSMYWSVFKK